MTTKALLWIALAIPAGIILAAGVRPPAPPPAQALEVLGTVPSFTLTDGSGRSVRSDELLGAPWVGAFIFTRCAGQCPVMTTRMKSVRRKLPGIRLVSFSVDPADSPAALAKYSKENGADWLFLTGRPGQVKRLSVEGFRLSAAEREGELIHSDKLALIDKAGRIRGYFDGMDVAAVDALEKAVATLQ
ncbi:MAG: SCO family protein [Elusimicrobia bacterium]|nr:SCO family protein [Elusimicrobiota bacterium]